MPELIGHVRGRIQAEWIGCYGLPSLTVIATGELRRMLKGKDRKSILTDRVTYTLKVEQ